MGRPPGRSTSRRALGFAVLVLLAALPACFPQPSCGLVPQLRDVTVNQGVGSYPVLARGKETLVRLYLSMPRCADADDSVRITGGALTVTGAGSTLGTVGAPTPNPVPAFPPITPFASSPARDSTGDPIFVVPGSMLAPAGTTAGFTATFSTTLRFEARTSPTANATTGSVTLSQTPQGTPITKPVERRTNALRLLVVPMGDPTKPFATQFTDAGRGAVQRGMGTVSRLMPVPAGVTELTGTGGVRYTILPSLLDLRPWLVDGVFCGTGANYNGFKGLLAQFLRTWNSAPTNPPADRVVGAVDAAISRGGDSGCAEGMASVGATEAWVRATLSASAPSLTGAVMTMELSHSLGLVPDARDNPFDPFHETDQQADRTAPDRGYNTQTRAFLADDRNAMRLAGNWNEGSVLFQPDDYAFLLCALGGVTGGCPTSGVLGSAVNVGAEPTFVISGTTDGTVPGTSVTESYFRLGVPRTEPEPGSEYRLVQRAGSTVVRDDGVLVETHGSNHDDDPSSVDEDAIGLFSAAVPFDTRATRVELRRGSTVLYARNRNGPPTFAGVTVDVAGTSGGSSGVEVVSVDAGGGAGNGPSFSQDVSADGRFVAFASGASDLVAGDTNGATDVFVRDRQTGTTQRVSVSSAEAQVDGPTGSVAPAISADGRFVAFVSDATALVAGDTNGAFDVFVRDRTAGTTERASVTSAETQVSGAVDLAVDISGNGNAVAFTATVPFEAGDTNGVRDVYVRDRSAGTTARASVTDTGAQSALAAVAGPSLSADGTQVAFTAPDLTADDVNTTLDVYVRNRSAGTTTLITPGSNGNSSQPSLSGDGRFVAFLSSATSLVAGDGNGVADVLLRDRTTGAFERVSVDTAEAQLPQPSYATTITSDGRRVAFLYGPSPGSPQVLVRDRPGGRTIPAGGGTDGVEPSLSGNGRFVAFGSATSQFAGDPGGERDVYLRDLDAVPPATAPGLRTAAVGVTDSQPENLRLDLYYVCGSVSYPVAVALVPSAVSGTVASFGTTFDSSFGCTGGQLQAVANDGFETASSEPVTVPDNGDDRSPAVAIVTPYPGTTVLEYAAIPLRGTAKDPESSDRVALRWSLDGTAVGTGPVLDLSPPAGGWPLGSHTITLSGVDSAGQPVSATRTITILPDANHDGVAD